VEFNIFNENALRRTIGYVPQHFDIDPKLPIIVEEVVLMGTYGKIGILKFPAKKEKELLKEVSSLLDIQYLLKKPFGQLSGGERKRVLIARALIKEPKIMLLDEIFAWLDMKMMEKVIDIIGEIHRKRNLTTLIVSHDIDMIEKLCSRVIWMEEGKIVFDGKKENFLKMIETKKWN